MFAEYTLGGKVCALFRLAKNSRNFQVQAITPKNTAWGYTQTITPGPFGYCLCCQSFGEKTHACHACSQI